MRKLSAIESIGGGFLILVSVATLVGVLIFFFTSPAQPSKTIFNPEAGKIYKMKPGFPIARYPAVIEQAVNLANDKEAYDKLLLQGDVALTPKDAQVYFVDANWGGIIKVRPKGEIVELWTLKEALAPL